LELFRILITFLKPDLATQLLFLRTFFWILIVFVLTNFFGFRLDLYLIIFVWSFFSFLSIVVTYVKFKNQVNIAFKGSCVYLKELVSLIIEAKYFIGMLLFSSIISYLDKFILNSNSNSDLTVYFFFFTVCSIISIVVSFSVGSFEGPKAIKVFALNGLNDYLLEKVKLQKAYLNVIVAITILLGIGIFPLLYFINKSEYWLNIHSFFILLISASLYTFSDVYKLDIFIAKKDSSILYIFLIASITNIILNFVLIRLFSIPGAAYASLITNSIIFFKLKASSKKVLNHFTNV
jgi:O-antigen/teichoic acid export membrane protein